MSKNKFYIVVLLLALIACACFISLQSNIAQADNTSAIIDINQESGFDAYGKVFAYTYGTSLYVAIDNEIKPYPNAFTGSCVGLVMNGSHILQ